MYPTIHDYTASDLDTQGFGALSDCISAEVSEELNGAFTLELRYPLKGAHYEYLIPGNVIMVKPNHAQTKQPFRISQVKRSFANSITVYANHISYDLSGYSVRLPRSYNSLAETITAMNAMSWASQNPVYHAFTFQTDKTSNLPFSMPAIQTLRSWMGGQSGSLIDVYGGEWLYDGFNCYLLARRGEDTGIRISYGKNLAEYEKQRDNSVYSHVCAYWKNGDDTKVSDLTATGANCTFRVAYIDVSKEFDSAPTTAQLNTSAASHASASASEFQSITVTPAQVGEVIGLGDSVLICYEGVFETRVVKTVWDALAGVYKTLELGDKKAGIADTIKTVTSSPSDVADYIIERGTSNGWTYKKWAGGDYECKYRSAELSVDVTTAWQGVYYGSIASVNFPITFTSLIDVEQTVEIDDGSCTKSPAPCTTSKTGGVYLYRPASKSGVKARYNISATGRWKN